MFVNLLKTKLCGPLHAFLFRDVDSNGVFFVLNSKL